MRSGHALAVALCVCACGADDVAIVGECVPDGAAVRIHDGTGVLLISPGLRDGHLLVTWERPVPQLDGNVLYTWEGLWLDESLGVEQTVSGIAESTMSMGRAAWVRTTDGMTAQCFLGPYDSNTPQIVHVRLDGTSDVQAITLRDLSTNRGCPDCTLIGWSDTQLGFGPDFRVPGVSTASGARFGVLGVPNTCFGGLLNQHEAFLFNESFEALVATRPAPALCARDAQDYPNNVALVPGPDSAPDTLGMLFRVGDTLGLGDTHFMQLRADGTVLTGPTLIGVQEQHATAAGGWDLVATRIGDGDVLFRERTAGADSFLSCYRLRTIHADGSGATDTRWQLPCVRSEGHTFATAPTITASTDLVEISGGLAVIVWGEHTGHDMLAPVLSTDTWSEAINVAIMGPTGRRGSDVVRVTTDESTALASPRTPTTGPWPSELTLQAASEGDHVVVTWVDQRADAPGVYARSFHCTTTIP